ncbi:TetR/AcrR family transcriptional regulator [Deinococcus cellulosilyticus]|uniref:TetR family transcriptional regulator n=1 Tax=Deinococcus cellulosilyticus (strain DSM 18568 / NBRC 106333 / KACC 11606 / 5516J-15) TaxID=1223518 RepID=A0A511N1K5_DEIC1|nr:TetR/AcrR family transcriptional regulator [Deinococcus cellulosilyticus]GEM46331.1 TetR family transcriptional regulator [Deinococcus cellulosilyticus NBRC 106333 = KACC 11606]
MSEKADTYNLILDVAQHLVQERGFNAFSYKDISQALGIKNASIHYHFPGKTDLGVALVRRYRNRLHQVLSQLQQQPQGAPQMLEVYLVGYRTVVHEDGRICLCAALAADLNTLPESIQTEVAAFFQLNQDWLSRVMEQGSESGQLKFSGSPQHAAEVFLATLEGGMLLARSYRDMGRFEQIGRLAIQGLLAQ